MGTRSRNIRHKSSHSVSDDKMLLNVLMELYGDSELSTVDKGMDWPRIFRMYQAGRNANASKGTLMSKNALKVRWNSGVRERFIRRSKKRLREKNKELQRQLEALRAKNARLKSD